jgi:hypothetical protein
VATSDDVKTISEELEKFLCLFEEVQSGVVVTRSQSSDGPEDLPGQVLFANKRLITSEM